MKAMARQRSHSIEFKRQVAQEFIAGESLYALSKQHDISRQLIRVWVQKYKAGALDEDAQAADLLQEYEAKIAALERMVGRQALEIEFLKGALKNAPRPRSVNTSALPAPRRLHRRRMPATGDWSLYFLRHARCHRARPEHRCGDENDLRRVRSLWLSACCRRTTPSWHCRERQENPPAHARACVESKAAEAFCRDDGSRSQLSDLPQSREEPE